MNTSTKLSFVKMQGAGNDFVVLNGLHGLSYEGSTLAKVLCDRNYGVGADGLLVVQSSMNADYAMSYFNADGSRSICGNGMRCVARYLFTHGILPHEQRKFDLETDTHIVGVEVFGRGERIRIDMGPPEFEGSRIPTASPGEQVGIGLLVGKQQVTVTAVSMGNPHCVLFVDNVDQAPVTELGPKIEEHSFFPQKTNVEFVQIVDSSHVRLRVWERGVGETLACGTGSCAVLAAGVRAGKIGREIKLESRGGEFVVSWDSQSDRIFLTGEAHEVFQGEIDLAQFFGHR